MYRRLTYLTCGVLALGMIPVNRAHADLIAWWPFNDGAGTAVVDASGNGHNGTINGNPTWAVGTLGGALNFDGTGDYVMCDLLNIDTAVTGGVTVCGWINKTAGGDRKLCSNRQVANAAGGGFSCSIYNDRMEMDISSATARVLARDAGGPAVPAGTWVHVAWVYDDVGNLFKEYHNGVEVDTDAVTVSVGVSTAPFRIGGDSPTVGYYYVGLMDDWRVYNHALSEAELQAAMAGKGPNDEFASDPSPADKATDVAREVVLSWSASELAAAHDVYFGTVAADVDSADRANPQGVLVSQSQVGTTYEPSARLELGQTYYWRIDEVNSAPDFTVFKGAVWSFTVEPHSYPIRNVTATASGSSAAEMSPAKTVDGSGLNANDQHSTAAADMWLSNMGGATPIWIQYAFDKEYKLDKLLVWNSNQILESFVGFGAKGVTIEYSVDGTTWTALGDFEFARAPGTAVYTANTTVDLAGVVAKYVKLTMKSNWGGVVAQYGLSEVRFLSVPVSAREPDPASGAADVNPDVTLSWRPGREAGSHRIYLSTDQQAVIDGTTAAVTVSQARHEATVSLGATYYWKVVEVNEAETPSSWDGPVWTFSTRTAMIVDDFESYTDNMDAGGTIFQAWIDGWGTTNNGSQVGYAQAPFAERTLIHGGKQSMPMAYNNATAPSSQAERTFDTPQDWTRYGLKTLSLWFYGDPNNSGTMYVKINNTKVTYPGPAGDLKKTQWLPWHIDLASTGASLTSVTKLAVGVDGAGAAGMLYIDDILLYPTTAELITPVDPGTNGLQAWYKFDGDLKDAMGKNNGTAVGDAKTVADPVRGQVLTLDGIGDAVKVPLLAASTSTLTITMWVNTAVNPVPIQFASFFNCDGWAAGDLHWRYSYGKINGGINGVAGGDFTGESIVKPNQWNHVAVTVSPTEVASWLNGYKEVSRPLTAVPTVILGDGMIGAWLNGANIERPFTGRIDDARFYNRTLSQEEIASLAGRTTPFAKPF